MSHTCTECTFFVPIAESTEGYCRYAPPVINPTEIGASMAQFPRCAGDWWCGAGIHRGTFHPYSIRFPVYTRSP
jgi:hypothetical protein